MSKLAIYGAAGFVGSHLLGLLTPDPDLSDIILIDRRPIPEPAQALLDDRFRVIQSDSMSALRDTSVDTLLILAGQSDVDAALRQPAEALRNNIGIAIDAAEWVRLQSERVRVIYMSSDEVLGVSTAALPAESPLRPTQPYAASKAAAELVFRTYENAYGIELVVIRSCNLVGGNQLPVKLIPRSVRCLLRNEPIPLYGDGLQLREWMAVEDICDALMLLLNPNVPPGTYQATSGFHLSTLGVIGLIAQALDKTPSFRHDLDRAINDYSYAMDSAALRSLGWAAHREPAWAIQQAARLIASQYANAAALDGPISESAY